VMRKERTASFNTAERWYAAEFAPALQRSATEPPGGPAAAPPDGGAREACEVATQPAGETTATVPETAPRTGDPAR
jgi:hypothetical protein